jgi:hypothetical protein
MGAAMASDPITGMWTANSKSGELSISFDGKTLRGFYDYIKVGKKKSKASILNDTNGNRVMDSADEVIGSFVAKTSIALEIPSLASGTFSGVPGSNSFSLFYENERYAKGVLFAPIDSFF